MAATSVNGFRTRKVLVRRIVPASSRRLRPAMQCVFFLLNLWLGIQFYLFVRQFEIPGSTYSIARPPGVEGWLPIAGLMNLKTFLLTGQITALHPATMFLLISFLSMSLLLRKAFCGWLCPVGALSEWLWKAGRWSLGRNFRLPRWLDVPLRGLKYILFGLFAYVVLKMTPEAIHAFLYSPYGIIADVKMLNFFRFLGVAGAIVLGAIAIASIFIQNFWCRYLCPYGALMGLVSMLSPLRIRRDPKACIDCAKCARACPSHLPVDALVQIRSAECLGCMECVNVCPAEGALDLMAPRRKRVQPWMVAAAIAAIFFGVTGYAKWTEHWESAVPNAAYERLIPNAAEYDHPH